MDLKEKILAGEIFVYPTDTIYGLGCNALDVVAVSKLKEIKMRDKDKPLSVIAPSKQWILDNCVVEEELVDKYLPGPYTLLLKKKYFNFLFECSETELIGVRIPDNDFTREIQESGVPFITTSVNVSGESSITKISELPEKLIERVDHIVDVGPLNGKPSTLVLNGKEISR